MFEEADLIHRYSRADALRDGVLIDASRAAREAGFRYPVALTAAAWARCVAVPPGVTCQDEAGRLCDVLTMPRFAIRRSGDDAREVRFDVHVRNDNREGRRRCGSGRCAGPGTGASPSLPSCWPRRTDRIWGPRAAGYPAWPAVGPTGPGRQTVLPRAGEAATLLLGAREGGARAEGDVGGDRPRQRLGGRGAPWRISPRGHGSWPRAPPRAREFPNPFYARSAPGFRRGRHCALYENLASFGEEIGAGNPPRGSRPSGGTRATRGTTCGSRGRRWPPGAWRGAASCG
jgi:hypothetical protein